jgi:hypothetical protein
MPRLLPSWSPWLCWLLLTCPFTALAEGADDPTTGLAVAPFGALEVAPTTAAILTGVAEGAAMELAAGGRFVAHGELLRTVDAGPDVGCRDEDCLARAAADRGAGLLLSGEVGRLGDTYVVTVHVVGCPDAETLATVSRQCVECEEGSLPTLLEDALAEALRSPEPASPTLSDDGHTVVMALQRRGGAFSYDDPYRTLSRSAVILDHVELSSLTRPAVDLGCQRPDEGARFTATLLAKNGHEASRVVQGAFVVEVTDDGSDAQLARVERTVDLRLDGTAAEEGGSTGVVKVEIEVPAGVRSLRVRSSFDDELLEELVTRPVGRVAEVSDFYLVHGAQRVAELAWGEPMEAHLLLTKPLAGAAAEVTLRLERKIRYWFDTENLQTVYEIPADEVGDFHLILPFVPDPSRRESTEGYHFEVWINGCQRQRTGLYASGEERGEP